MQFFEQWDKLENLKAKVILKHSLFGRQIHNCNSLQMINDDRLGVVIKGQEIFVNKQEIVQTIAENGIYVVSDDKVTITIIVNKL